jgi:hypothetical protein
MWRSLVGSVDNRDGDACCGEFDCDYLVDHGNVHDQRAL